MGLDDGPADGEPQAHAAFTCLRQAEELIEDPVPEASRDARAPVSHLQMDPAGLVPGPQVRFLSWRVTLGVRQEVDQHLLDEDRVERGQGKALRQVHMHGQHALAALHPAQGRADNLFKGLPFLLDLDVPALQPREVEEVPQQMGQPLAFVLDHGEQVAPGGLPEPGRAAGGYRPRREWR